MTFRFGRWSIIALVAVSALALAACGGGSSKNSSSSASSGGTSTSSGGSSSNNSSASSGTGSDDAYVAAICSAEKKFEDTMNSITSASPTSMADVTAMMNKLGPAIQQFADDFAKAKPPADLKDWHNATAKQMSDLAAQMKSGNSASAFNPDAATIPDPPTAIMDRLGKVAAKNKDCLATHTFTQ